MAQSPKTIVVFGGTGLQGGSVVRALKDDKRFVVKAATRNVESESAKKLAAQGIEVISVDMENPESCKAALKGAYGAFLVTSFIEHFDWDREVLQGKTVVDAAKANGIQHLIFSGVRSPKELIGKDGCYHMENKKIIADYIHKQGVPHTIVKYPCYYNNFITFIGQPKNEKGEYVLDFPIGNYSIEMVPPSDCGEVIHQMFLHPKEFIGRWVGMAADRLTVQQVADIFTKKLGRKFVPGTTTPEQFAKFPIPGAEDFAVMFEFQASGKDDHDFELTRVLHPSILTFEQWVDQNLDVISARYP